MFQLVPIDVLVAAALASPWLLNALWGFAVARGRGRPEATWASRLYQGLNDRVGLRLDTIAWLAIDWILLRSVVWAWQSQPVPIAAGSTVLAAGVFVFSGFGILAVHNLALKPFALGPGLPLDLEEHFPAYRGLDEHWREIREELMAEVPHLADAPEIREVFPDIGLTRCDEGPTDLPEGHVQGWNLLVLRLGTRDIPSNMARFPVLAGLLAERPEVLTAWFSILQPGVRLKPHRGAVRGVLRYHLGLVVPEPKQTWIDVGDVCYHWREGESVLFDDVFVHAAHNTGTKARVVLFINVLRRVPPPMSWVSGLGVHIGRATPYNRAVVARAEASAARLLAARDQTRRGA